MRRIAEMRRLGDGLAGQTKRERRTLRARAAGIALLASLLFFSLGYAPEPGARAADRPNVLIIVTDDQRASRDTLKMLPTVMRKFTRRGLWFRNAAATTPLCCPSRVSIFSGQYVHNHGTRFNSGKSWTAEDQKQSLQYTMRNAGYKTAISGKFVNFWRTDPPYFDRWATSVTPGYYGSTFNVDGRSVTTRRYSTSFIKRRALEFLEGFEQDDDTPWLMFVEPWAPHQPAIPQRKYASAPYPRFVDNPARSSSDRSDKPSYVQRRSPRKRKVLELRANMLRTLLSVDDMAKALFKRLRTLGERNTIIVFMSDNGFQWYEHKLVLKRFPYNGSVRIPMFLSWPGHLPAGEKRWNIVGNIDVAPTIYELTGVEPDYRVDGRSMLSSKRKHILVEYWQERHKSAPPTWKALWHPEWTYVEYEGVPESDRREYYGRGDRWQLDNVYGNDVVGDEPSNARRLARRLDRAAVCAGDSCP